MVLVVTAVLVVMGMILMVLAVLVLVLMRREREGEGPGTHLPPRLLPYPFPGFSLPPPPLPPHLLLPPTLLPAPSFSLPPTPTSLTGLCLFRSPGMAGWGSPVFSSTPPLSLREEHMSPGLKRRQPLGYPSVVLRL